MITKTPQCAVLMTCHNRKAQTLACLASLFFQDNAISNEISDIPQMTNDTTYFQCYLVDDGCVDGTVEAVSKNYPQVKIIKGSGDLYWNKGMRLAWKTALNDNFYDYYLWLNDDVVLRPNVIGQLITTLQTLNKENERVGALVGSLQNPITLLPSYGGRNSVSRYFPLKYGEVITPESAAIPCDFINGNCTLISAHCVDTIGILSDDFTHSMGDFDYGLRMAKQGFCCFVAPYYVGQCSNNQYKKRFQDKNLSLSQRISLLKQPTIMPPTKEWKLYVKRHGGLFWSVYYLKAWLREVLPILWVIKWK
ncbi:MAG: glycosyltransferase family 2 protein [Colwellia sp.]